MCIFLMPNCFPWLLLLTCRMLLKNSNIFIRALVIEVVKLFKNGKYIARIYYPISVEIPKNECDNRPSSLVHHLYFL